MWCVYYVFLKIYLFTLFVWMSSLYVCVCSTYSPGTLKSSRGIRSLGRSRVKYVVSCCMGARNWTLVLFKSSQCSLLLSHISSSNISFYENILTFNFVYMCKGQRLTFESLFSFNCVDSEESYLRLGGKCLYQLNHLASLWTTFKDNIYCLLCLSIEKRYVFMTGFYSEPVAGL